MFSILSTSSSSSFLGEHFILEGDVPRELKRDELLKAMLAQPPGSLIYVKSMGRKLGMLSCLRFAATERAGTGRG
ncbi:MAG: hypothetical protein RXR02_07965 [Thermoproteus sp.]